MKTLAKKYQEAVGQIYHILRENTRTELSFKFSEDFASIILIILMWNWLLTVGLLMPKEGDALVLLIFFYFVEIKPFT